MERLTKKRAADAQRIDYEKRLVNGYPRNVPEERFLRLAAYEDTGLEPEEVDALKAHTRILSDLCNGIGALRLKKLADADRDGRVVLLPCKVGDCVFLSDRDRGFCYECEVEYVNIGRLRSVVVVRCKCDGCQAGATFSAFGKTVFFTREEAEAALKEGRS